MYVARIHVYIHIYVCGANTCIYTHICMWRKYMDIYIYMYLAQIHVYVYIYVCAQMPWGTKSCDDWWHPDLVRMGSRPPRKCPRVQGGEDS